jgi:hypothetical protein
MLVLNSFVFTYLITFYFKKPEYLLYHLVFSIVFQNVLVGLGNTFTHYQTNGENLKLLFIYKELFAGMIFFFLFIKYKKEFKLLKYEKIVIAFILWVLVSFVISSGADFENKFFYLRQYCILFVSYFIGRFIYFGFKTNPKRIYFVLKLTVWLGVVSVIFGFLFYFIDRNSPIWKEWFNIDFVLQAKGIPDGKPNWDTPIGNLMLPRMFSIFFDVISLSYFILVALCCSLLLRRTMSVIFIRCFLLSGLILTLGKGAFGIYMIVLTWVYFLYTVKIRPRTFIAPLLISAVAFFLVAYNSGVKSSAIVHFDGFILPLLNSYMHPIGNGLGSGGVYYAMTAGINAWELSAMGTESFLGSLIYQLGYPGLLCYLIFFIGCINYLLKNAYTKTIDYKLIVLSGIMFALIITSSFQEATLGINYSGILTILVGFTISQLMNEQKKSVE